MGPKILDELGWEPTINYNGKGSLDGNSHLLCRNRLFSGDMIPLPGQHLADEIWQSWTPAEPQSCLPVQSGVCSNLPQYRRDCLTAVDP